MNDIPERLHQPTRYLIGVVASHSLRDDVAEIVAVYSKGCLVGPPGSCIDCMRAALHAIELRLLAEDPS